MEQPESENLERKDVTSFRDGTYASQEMKKLLSLHEPDDKIATGLNDVSYHPANVFPDWILNNTAWRNAPRHVENANEISDILNTPLSKRTSDQNSKVIHWLMSVWGIANSMGLKRCAAMFKEFNFSAYEPGENVITEGERGLTFYIIVSGTASVHKDGIGIVGQLSKGKGFGEVALTQGKDLRTATVTAITRLEVLSLRKLEYDYFVRDLQEMEKRENFMILSQCKLFRSWPKGKIEKACNSCFRKTFDAGEYIFRQGDPPDDLFVVVEGNVNIFKELVIVCKNRWPTGVREWKERIRRVTKPIMLTTLQRGEFFGEMAILKNQARSTSAIAGTRCVLITLDKLEFLHLVSHRTVAGHTVRDDDEELQQALQKYVDDDDIIEIVNEIKGGPNSAAFVGNKKVQKTELDHRVRVVYTKENHTESQSPKKVGKVNGETSRAISPSAGRLTNGKLSVLVPRLNEKEMMEITRQEDVTEKIRKAVMKTSEFKEDKLEPKTGFKIIQAFSHPEQTLHNTQRKLTPKNERVPSPLPHSRQGRRNEQKSSPTNNNHIQSSSPLIGPPRSSIAFTPQKRLSLPGLDNDNTYNFDPNRIVLRRNSAISFGRLYEHFYQQLKQEGLTTATQKRTPTLRRSMIGAPINYVGMSNDEGDSPPVVARVPFSESNEYHESSSPIINSPPSQVIQLQPLLTKLSRRDSQRSRLMARSASFVMDSHANLLEDPRPYSERDHLEMESSKRRTQIGMSTPVLKLLNKPKISYRDVMES